MRSYLIQKNIGYRYQVSILFVFFLMAMMLTTQAQQDPLHSFNTERKRINSASTKILGSYAVANILYGSIAASQTSGTKKYFHEMNAIWNGVTGGIIAFGYLTSRKETTNGWAATIKKQQSVEKLYLFNAGLDLAYIAGGVLLQERSKTATRKPERLKGYGQSVVLQGAFLLLYDAVMYTIHLRHGKSLSKLMSNMQLGATENGVGVLIKL